MFFETTYFFDRSTAQGRLELTDRDRLDLLHRMSTNDLNVLKPGQGATTVLTTALARTIDMVTVYHRGESVLMLSFKPSVVRSWLQRHIFWNDKLKIRDVSDALRQFEVHGPGAATVIEAHFPGATALPIHHFMTNAEGDLAARTFSLNGDGFTVVVSANRADALRAVILSHSEVREGDETVYERLRIEAGLPGPAHELTEDYIPLEAGLWDSVSFKKGCYIGQEIIARMESRNKIAKVLVKVALDQMAEPGAALISGDRNAGVLTSVIQSDDGAIGLAFVNPDFSAPGTTLSLKETATQAVVQTAPLIQHRV